jgi:hypothetical protein
LTKLRNMRKIAIFLVFIAVYTSQAQTLNIFDIDTRDFPTVKANFIATDANGDQITDLSTSDFVVTEDGIERKVISVTCPSNEVPEPISAVIMVDRSGSMSGEMLDIAKTVARSWIDATPGNCETAICSFNHNNFFEQDFTNDKNKLLSAVNNLSSDGGTDFNAGFINPMAGALVVAEKAKHRPVVIFITDGFANGNESAIIAKAKSIGSKVYCITLGNKCPLILRNIAKESSGRYFENITSEEDIEKIFKQISTLALIGSTCSIKWISREQCLSKIVEVDFSIPKISSNDYDSYIIPYEQLASIFFQPKGIFFDSKPIGVKADTTVTITATGADFNITNIISSNPAFEISPRIFFLADGQSLQLIVSYTPQDSNYAYAEFDLENDMCIQKLYSLGSYPDKKNAKNSLRITHPNGGEEFLVGSDTIITWEGVLPQDTLLLEFSIDSGSTWSVLTSEATNLKYFWKNIPKPTSDNCLIRISFQSSLKSNSEIEWQRCLGGSGRDEANSIMQTMDDGYIIAGYTTSSDGDISGYKGKGDAWIAKLDYYGNLQWQRCLGGSEIDVAFSVKQTVDGGYVVACQTYSNDKDVTDNYGDSDYWIVKLDADGNIEWQKCIGGSSIELANDIIQTQDFGYVIAGYTRSNDEDVSGYTDGGDAWIVKLDNSGNLVWQKCLGGSNFDELSSIQDTQDGGFITAGNTLSDDGDVSGYHDYYDAWVVKIDGAANIQWQRCLGGTKIDIFESIQETQDGGFIAAGHTVSTDGDIEGSHGNYEAWIVKLDKAGNIQWQKCLGGSSIEEANSIQQTEDGGYIVAGKTGSVDGDVSGVNGWMDYWIVKLDEAGNIQWQKCLGGDNKEEAFSIYQTSDNGYVVAGVSPSNNGDVSGNHGIEDAWIVKIAADGSTIAQSDTSDAVFSIVMPRAESHDINMREVVVGSSKDSVIVDFLVNTGSYRCRIDNIYFEGDDPSAFRLNGPLPEYAIEKGNQQFAEFKFSPDAVRDFEAEVVIVTQSETLRQRITGRGVEEMIAANAEIIDFGLRELFDYRDTTVAMINNVSTDDIEITKIEMLGPDTEQFQFVDASAEDPFVLAGGQSHEMSLRFNPKYIGRTSGQIAFYFDGAGSPAIAQLFGAGVGASIRASYDSAYAGDNVDFEITLEMENAEKFSEVVGSYEGIIRFEKSILGTSKASDLFNISMDSSYVKFSGNVTPESTMLSTIPLKAGLGRVGETSIDFESMKWYDNDGNLLDYETDFTSGRFKLLGICEENGERLFNPSGTVQIKSIIPNPAEDKIEISFSLIEKGYTEISIYNQLGEKVRTIFAVDVLEKIDRTIESDISDLGSGQYLLVLKTPTYSESRKVMIVR